ncbi:RraA family protein [Diaphorobacter sp. DS2]|uniref:Putative 4-hydroxy-4-methyl-2-oxoglutarate aldolase n=1 Tax=Cytobacillus oceanisediminis TaxID=665099 RepID=A0ABX3CMW6_9BACI|nr:MULTISPECIES: RraA family protein [Cytobacillus]OHX44843.1 methyltransferase [Cytobacillus oceanisediminis]TFI47282.1 RraA family protein [Diaphorobacter sp. DS2]
MGFRILPVTKRVEKSVIDQYRNVVTPHISDNLNRLHAINSSLRPYHKEGKLLGTAITVKTRPGDNLMVHKAIEVAEPGDVIVVDAGGDTTNAIIGEIMLEISKKRGITGFIIDGAIRDTGAFMKGDFPVYAKGVTHRGPYKDGPGEINVPVSIGGMVVHPGDLLVGDEDGVAVIPVDKAEEILALVKKQEIREKEIFEEIEEGTIDRTWIDNTLKQKGCEYIEFADKI